MDYKELNDYFFSSQHQEWQQLAGIGQNQQINNKYQFNYDDVELKNYRELVSNSFNLNLSGR